MRWSSEINPTVSYVLFVPCMSNKQPNLSDLFLQATNFNRWRRLADQWIRKGRLNAQESGFTDNEFRSRIRIDTLLMDVGETVDEV